MMRFLIILLIIILSSCNNLKPQDEKRVLYNSFELKDLMQIELKQYEAQYEFSSILNSVIDSVIECAKYENMQYDFIVTSYYNSENNFIVNIENIVRVYEFDYSRCNGVLYFHGYRFFHIGVVSDVLIKELDRDQKVFFVRKEKLEELYDKNDEFFLSSWTYKLEDNEFILISQMYCLE